MNGLKCARYINGSLDQSIGLYMGVQGGCTWAVLGLPWPTPALPGLAPSCSDGIGTCDAIGSCMITGGHPATSLSERLIVVIPHRILMMGMGSKLVYCRLEVGGQRSSVQEQPPCPNVIRYKPTRLDSLFVRQNHHPLFLHGGTPQKGPPPFVGGGNGGYDFPS